MTLLSFCHAFNKPSGERTSTDNLDLPAGAAQGKLTYFSSFMQMRNTVSLQCARGLSAAKKMSNCFDCERTDVTEKRRRVSETQRRRTADLCTLQDCWSLRRWRRCARERAEFVASCPSSGGAAAGCPGPPPRAAAYSWFFKTTYSSFCFPQVDACDRRWENLGNIYIYII